MVKMSSSSSQKKHKGVRCRKWVSEIQVQVTKHGRCLGPYTTCDEAAVAQDIAYYCLRGTSSVQSLNLSSMFLTHATSPPPPPPPSSPPLPLPAISPLKWLSEDNQAPENSTSTRVLESEDQYIQGEPDNSPTENVLGLNALWKRPASLVVPAPYHPGDDFGEVNKKLDNKEYFEVEEREYCLSSKKGKRKVMEDGYGVMLDVLGDPKQAFFGVIDGHGGCAAAEYAAENLGKNIVKALAEEDETEAAIRGGYLRPVWFGF